MSSIVSAKDGDDIIINDAADNNNMGQMVEQFEKNVKVTDEKDDNIDDIRSNESSGINNMSTKKCTLSLLDEKRLKEICKKSGAKTIDTAYDEPTLIFFTRLYKQFEEEEYNNKTKELYAKAISIQFQANNTTRNWKLQRETAGLMQNIICLFEKPKIVKNLSNILHDFKDGELQDQINTVRDMLRGEEMKDPEPINMNIIEKLEVAFTTVETYHSAWQRARLFDVVYNTIQSVSDQGISNIDVLGKLKELLCNFVDGDNNANSKKNNNLSKKNYEKSVVFSDGTIGIQKFTLFSENQSQKLKSSLEEIGDIDLTMLYVECSRGLSFSRSRNGPMEPEELYKHFENIIEYLKKQDNNNIVACNSNNTNNTTNDNTNNTTNDKDSSNNNSKKSSVVIDENNSLHDNGSTKKKEDDTSKPTLMQIKKIGKLFSEKLIPKIIDSVWKIDITTQFFTLLSEVENIFADVPELAEVRAEIHYAYDDMKTILEEDFNQNKIDDKFALGVTEEILISWCKNAMKAAKQTKDTAENKSNDDTATNDNNNENNNKNSLNFKRLHKKMMQLIKKMMPGKDEESRKDMLKKSIAYALKCRWNRSRLFVFGSSGNLYGSPSSDMDMCVRLRSPDKAKSCFQIRAALRQYGHDLDFDDINVIARARVPIVKFVELNSGIECDICVDNELAVHNTRLLKAYASLDPRVRHVGLFIKQWAAKRGVKRSDSGTLSSYAWIILSIFWLQTCGMIPSLQIEPFVDMQELNNKKSKSGKKDNDKGKKRNHNNNNNNDNNPILEYEGCNIAFCSETGSFRKLWPRAVEQAKEYNATVSELIYGFFYFFSNIFNTRHSCASIRLGQTVEKGDVYPNGKRWRICIEDPFDLSHDLGTPVSRSGQTAINEELNRALTMLKDGCKIEELLAENDTDNYLPENISSQRRRQEKKSQNQRKNTNRGKKPMKQGTFNTRMNNGPGQNNNNRNIGTRVIPGMGEVKKAKRKKRKRKKKATA